MENEMLELIEKLREVNEKQQDILRDIIWHNWREFDIMLFEMKLKIEKQQEEMGEDLLKAQNDH